MFIGNNETNQTELRNKRNAYLSMEGMVSIGYEEKKVVKKNHAANSKTDRQWVFGTMEEEQRLSCKIISGERR